MRPTRTGDRMMQPARPCPGSTPKLGRAPARGDGAYSALAIARGAWRALLPGVGEVAAGIGRAGCAVGAAPTAAAAVIGIAYRQEQENIDDKG